MTSNGITAINGHLLNEVTGDEQYFDLETHAAYLERLHDDNQAYAIELYEAAVQIGRAQMLCEQCEREDPPEHIDKDIECPF